MGFFGVGWVLGEGWDADEGSGETCWSPYWGIGAYAEESCAGLDEDDVVAVVYGDGTVVVAVCCADEA